MSSAMFKVASRAMKSLYWSSLKSLVLALSQYRLFLGNLNPLVSGTRRASRRPERTSISWSSGLWSWLVSIRSLSEAGILSERDIAKSKADGALFAGSGKTVSCELLAVCSCGVFACVAGAVSADAPLSRNNMTRSTMPQIIRSVALMCASSEIWDLTN